MTIQKNCIIDSDKLSATEQQLKTANQQLQEKEHFLSVVFSSIQDGISILDTDLNIIRVNSAIEKWYAHVMPLTGKKCYEAYHGRKQPCEVCPTLQAIKTGKPEYEVVPLTGKGGKIVGWLDLYSFPMIDPATGQLIGVIEFVRDITERKKAEQSLMDLNEKLIKSNQQLQEFTYVASHDLREPVRKINSFGQLLVDSLADKLSDDERENFDFMIDGAYRMEKMIEALLTFSRISTKGVEFEPLDLNEIVKQIRELELAVKLEETNGTISVPEPLPAVQGDAAQIRQLMQNLVSNAIKYHKKDVPPEVTIRAHKDDNEMVRVEVQDNGIGIEKEQYDKAFVMFRRLHSRDEYEGTGIGLAVCKRIVERHGGEIGVESTYGESSTFWFTLPVSDSTQEQQIEPELVLANSDSNNNQEV